jgi:hypothetical protein
MFPSNDSATRHSLPSTGFPRYQFPCFLGTMECSDILRPSNRARLPSPGNTMRCGLCFRSVQSRSPDRGPGVHDRSPLPVLIRMEAFRTSQVPGEPSCSYAVFSDPGGTDASGVWTSSVLPPLCPQRRLPRQPFFRGSIARPWNSLCTLREVDCSAMHATLASGRWPALPGGIGYPQGSNERFQRSILTSLPPFPSFAWRKDIAGFSEEPATSPTFISSRRATSKPRRRNTSRNCSSVWRPTSP